ncbi:MAG: UDP-N-acetylmuramoyl-L-alanine--D-glutamate ligase [Burkholderiales bacterium]|nr:UDP-N-acetylmuramoyl-L-alanine--D-glutamate ligase [Burkholderiales bacterium]
MELANRRILVLGLGESGLSMARHLAAAGAVLSAADTRPDPPGRAAFVDAWPQARIDLGPLDPAVFADVDAVAVSPGVAVAGPQADPAVAAARAQGLRFFGDMELFAAALADERAASGYRPKIVAITGTNGKTTVTSLTAFLAERAGRRALAAGNIGPAVLDAWRAARAAGALPEVWVLELSSFQLETTHSLAADVAVVLNVSEDHLDRHGTMADYASAKARIFANGAVQVLNRDDARTLAMRLPFQPKSRRERPPPVYTFGTDAPASARDFGLVRDARPGGVAWLAQGAESEDAEAPAPPRRLMPQEALRIRGAHNAANALAALALLGAIGLPLAPLLKGLAEYAGLPHRVQHVARIDGVDYVDDSKGTNVGATVAALAGLGADLGAGARIVLIAGGEGKGQDFAPLAAPYARFCRAAMLIGRDGAALGTALGAGANTLQCASLEEAVREAAARAQPGDTVLLSPACASFDMFRNYAHRAEVFVAAVRDLGRTATPPQEGSADA